MDESELTPEQLQQLIELGVLDDKSSNLQDQMHMAQKLRYGQGPEGRQAGNAYVAANPLEHIAHAWEGIRAGKEIDDLKHQQDDILNKQVAGRTLYAKGLPDMLRKYRTPPYFPEDQGAI